MAPFALVGTYEHRPFAYSRVTDLSSNGRSANWRSAVEASVTRVINC